MLKYNFLSAPLALVITKTKMKQTVLTNPQTYSTEETQKTETPKEIHAFHALSPALKFRTKAGTESNTFAED